MIPEITSSTEEEAHLVDGKLVAFNQKQVPFTQTPNPIIKNYVIKEQGQIIAGINAFIYHWRILHTDILFVDEQHRGKDLGSALLEKVETEARLLGATLAHLDTFDFQAKDFYLKQGYEIFGVLENCPEGHKRYYMKKSLIK